MAVLVLLVIALRATSEAPAEKWKPIAITSKVVGGYCVVSHYNERRKYDELWLAQKRNGRFFRVIKLPDWRYDRNVPDKINLRGNRMIVQLNLGVDLLGPTFLARRNGRWTILPKPSGMDGGPGGDNIIRLGDNLVGVVRSNYLYVFGKTGLKVAKVQTRAPHDNLIEIRKLNEEAFELEFWGDGGLASAYFMRCRWPIEETNGYWMLEAYRRKPQHRTPLLDRWQGLPGCRRGMDAFLPTRP